MLIELGGVLPHYQKNPGALLKLVETLSQSTRETDTKGWYKTGCALGVIFTEVNPSARAASLQTISNRIQHVLLPILPDDLPPPKISFRAFPDDRNESGGDSAGRELDFTLGRESISIPTLLKRLMDLVGSLSALVASLPLLISIAVAIKLTSKGPILFRQRRVGMHGRTFTFLKFRSMYAETGHAIHEEYVKTFISGVASTEGIYKLKDDPRVTPIGRMLRKTSLDELPQFFNVLAGNMSLVGPRPPIEYEVNRYLLWHKRRFLSVKPGITGLWQVKGRSKVKFDDMVRLDLQYVNSWSLWLDIKILLQTPWTVIKGAGAY